MMIAVIFDISRLVSDRMSNVPEPVLLLGLGVGLIALSVGLSARTSRKAVSESTAVAPGLPQTLGETATA